MDLHGTTGGSNPLKKPLNDIEILGRASNHAELHKKQKLFLQVLEITSALFCIVFSQVSLPKS